MCCSALQYVAMYCSMLQCVAVCYSVLQCAAVCCNVSQCVAACCSVLQCAAMCCCVLLCVADDDLNIMRCNMLQGIISYILCAAMYFTLRFLLKSVLTTLSTYCRENRQFFSKLSVLVLWS